MSVIREALSEQGTSRRRSSPSGGRPRWGVLDLCLTVLVVAAMITRTPTGGLLTYGWERLRGHSADLPTLTAWFSSGAAAPPAEILDALPAPLPAVPDALPEPWRTATNSSLSGRIPHPLRDRLKEAGQPVDAEHALLAIDEIFRRTQDPTLALEEAALGTDAVTRAVGRAAAAGEEEPVRFESHRRFLSASSADEADRFVGGTVALATVLDLAWPLQIEHRITSPYGERMHPTLKVRKFHDGIDLSVPIGTEIHAAQAGKLAVVGKGGASGNYVVMDHGFGVRTSYCHLSETPLARGTEVERGDVIALSGNTGRSTGPHLHYGVRIAGKTVDPERFRSRP
ncbi:MAG: M23 family metallopeptidase [Myxococcales bacterium]|nr:M23 family metallopeptidase [Myxococcales bacterium]